jgi:O-antigen/teichoic acid export membrane protein
VKVTTWTSLSTIIKLGSGFITVKVLAIFAGPEGMAALGQLSNLATILTTLATGAINTGVTKYIAEYSADSSRQDLIITAAGKITLACSFLIGLILVFTAEPAGSLLFRNGSYYSILQIFGLTIGLYAFNNLFISILNGYKYYKEYVIVSIVSSILVMTSTILMVFFLGTYGALLSLVTAQSVAFLVTFLVARRLNLKLNIFKHSINWEVTRLLLSFSLATIISVILVPGSQLAVRYLINEYVSAESAGIWEGLNRISMSYLMLVTTSIQVYYLPRLSEITDKKTMIAEIKSTMLMVLPTLFVFMITLFLAKVLVVAVLFSPEFAPMEDLFLGQLLGDFFKIASWLIAFAMPAKAMLKQFIITELIFNSTFVLFSYLFLIFFGFLAIPWAYFLNYLIYFLSVTLIIKHYRF